MNFSKTTGYSLTILTYMVNHSGENVSADFLHSKLGIPYQYLRQILTKLSKTGFIVSSRGRKGGFELTRDVSTIYIADIIGAIEGLEGFNTCILGFQECPFNNKCSIHNILDEPRANILKILKQTSLEDLIIK
ncbi:MAG: Rrf2 family transcriptional regulator [Bacteroidales bacterium]|nr:Rrf2 family transcriptional regulator [Bacteroidales bacterium]